MSLIPNFNTNGIVTRPAAAAIQKGQALKLATGGGVTPCALASDKALYIAQYDAAAGQNVACGVLGNINGTTFILATAALAPGDPVGVLGQVAATGAMCVGLAVTSAKVGEYCEIAHRAASPI